MSVFTQRVNPVTGAVDWEMQPESYDYQQEVARSAYADMLHDTERVSAGRTAERGAAGGRGTGQEGQTGVVSTLGTELRVSLNRGTGNTGRRVLPSFVCVCGGALVW